MKYIFESSSIDTCRECDFAKRERTWYYCNKSKYIGLGDHCVELDSKPDWCPLIEVKE